MAQGYRAQPKDGGEDLAKLVKDVLRRVAQLEGAATNRFAGITGGDGLTVGAAGSPQVQIVADAANPTAGGTVYFNQAADPNVAGGINGVTNQLAIFAPFRKGTTGGDVAEILLTSSFPELNEGGTLTLLAGSDAGMTIFGRNVISGLGGSAGHVSLMNFDIYGDTSGSRLMSPSGSLVFPLSVAEARIRSFDDSVYEPIRASAFTVSSSREVKQQITDLGWSPLDVVRRAKARSWRYRPDHGDPDRTHVGPMAEDLPAELVDTTSEVPALDLGVLVGVLWGAVQELAAQVRDLQQPQGRPA